MTISLARFHERLEREELLAPGSRLPESLVAAEVRDVTTDSRLVGRGSVFVAIHGAEGDGHQFVSDAEREGAIAAVVHTPVQGVEMLQIVSRDTRLAAAYGAAELFDDPWNELTVVGITGTNGKTTSAAILRHLLCRRSPTASIGTLGAVGPDGQVIPGTEGLTTPGPIMVARWLRMLHGDGARAVVMEVSSHALHQSRVAACRFDAALFTNLSQDHLDYHETLDAYRAAKLGLMELVKPGGAVVLNADDPAWDGVQSPRSRIVRFGVQNAADVRAEGVRASALGMSCTLRTPDGSAELDIPLYGLYNVANAVGAAAVLWSLGWETAEIAADLATLPQVPGRLERVPTPAGSPTVLIDYAHTPDALARALAALRPLVSGRLIAVFGAGGDRDRGKRRLMGRAAAEHADFSVVTTDNPRHEPPAGIAEEVESGMGNAPRQRVLDRAEAIRFAIENAGADDLVLLAGKGHETYQIWGTEKRPFDERAVVRDILAAEGGNR
jgi:UDP-N-acetylmuramoyl-L-alanyl-D-glutamate--2,6-diaminopimelate ligase